MAGKGHNEILETINPVKHTRVVTDAVRDHMPENDDVISHMRCQKVTCSGLHE
jgi:hypothetical protein